MLRSFLFVLLTAATITMTRGRFIPPEQTGTDCEGYRSLLTRVLVQFGATYFADNPRLNNTQLDPSQIDPLTPAELFKVFYGSAATPKHFLETILEMYYSDPGPDGPSLEDSDRIVLRDNIYTYAKANSYELAREKFGLLLYLGITDYAEHSADWLNRRCLRGNDLIENAEYVITAELSRVRNEIGEFKFGSFLELGSGTTLAFVIDDTGSMAGEIAAAKQRANQIIDERQGSLDQPQNFVLVPFNDPSVGPLTTTDDPLVFKQAIAKLRAHGGGDAPELALRGMLLAVENSRPGSTIFVITDIDAKDVELQDLLVAQAQQKSIKIIFLLTNRFSGSSLCTRRGRPTDSLYSRRCSTPSFSLGYSLYDYIATSTGGRILVVSKNDIFEATQVVDSTVKQGVVDIHRQMLSSGNHVVSIQVDSSIIEVFLQLTGGCESSGVAFKEASLEIVDSYTVDKLFEGKVNVENHFGEWRITVNSTRNCSFQAIGRSTKGFITNLGIQKRRLDGEIVLESFEGQPLITNTIVLLVDSFGRSAGDEVNRIELVAQDTGNSFHSFRILNPSANQFRVSPPRNPITSFYVAIQGTDAKGFEFHRISSSPIQFVSEELNCDNINDFVFRPGDNVNITLSIYNPGNDEASFEVGATDTQRYITKGVYPSLVAVRGGQRATSVIEVSVAKKAIIGETSIVTITAKSSELSYLLHKTCRVVVGQRLRPTVESFTVDATISSRFAQTVMTSVVYNNVSVSREAEFQIVLPIDAFITAFSMTIDGNTYDGTIEESQRAQRIFNAAKERGLTVGHVAARDTSTTIFRTSVNLAPFKRVTFRLTYQELLQREDNLYTYGVSVVTFQPVQEFAIDIAICESEEIINVFALGFETDQSSIPNPIAVPGISIEQLRNTAQVTYRPSQVQQTTFSPLGLNGKFIVKYELLLDDDHPGQLLVSGTNFAYFASLNVDPMPKRVIFALDISGSMFGHKYKQLKLAMSDILDNLLPRDEFSIVLFNNSVTRWNPVGAPGILAPATSRFTNQAKRFLEDIPTQGSTDILQALQATIEQLSEAVNETQEKPVGGIDDVTPIADYVILLTDGRSTAGVTNSQQIVSAVANSNRMRFGIHTIGLGTLVDAKMLATLAAQNSGTSIQIFVDVDTHIQMVNFFNAISRPLMYNINVSFPEDKVPETSERNFASAYGGQELTAAGQLINDEAAIGEISVTLRGRTRKESSTITENLQPRNIDQLCQPENFQAANFIKRLEIFLRLKDILSQIKKKDDPIKMQLLRERALNLSLENAIVTPGITSLVVLKPEDRAEVEESLNEESAETTTRSPGTTTRSPGTTTTPPSTVGRFIGEGGGRGSVFGDPHFVVQLDQQLTVCFDWQGSDNEIYNLLHDSKVGITVNAKMVVNKRSRRPNVTVVGEMAFLFARRNLSAVIHPSMILLQYGDKERINIPLSKTSFTKKRGVHFHVKYLSRRFTIISIGHKRVLFKIFAQRRIFSKNGLDHLAFSIANATGLSIYTTGLLGQFPDYNKQPSSFLIDFIPDSNQSFISDGKRKAQSTHKLLHQFFSNRDIDCWNLNNVSELTGYKPADFLLSDLMEESNF